MSAHRQQQVVVITGASSGAGRAAALAFAKEGAKLVLAARREAPLQDLATECTALGGEAFVQPTDVTNRAAVAALVETAVQKFGLLDVWVNNAGVLAAGLFDETPFEVHEQVIKTNLLGYMHGAYVALPQFKKQGHGILINNISVGGWFPTPYAGAYSASKFGLRGFGESLQAELSAYKNIHVCNLYPAFLDTPGMQHAANFTGKALKPAPPVFDPQAVAKEIVKLARHPRATTTVGFVSPLLRLGHAVAPRLMGNSTAGFIRTYLKGAPDMQQEAGNLFHPQEHGTSIHGGWNSPADRERRQLAFTKALLVVGAVVGITLLRRL